MYRQFLQILQNFVLKAVMVLAETAHLVLAIFAVAIAHWVAIELGLPEAFIWVFYVVELLALLALPFKHLIAEWGPLFSDAHNTQRVRHWTSKEDEVLQRYWPNLSILGRELPNRSIDEITGRGRRNGL